MRMHLLVLSLPLLAACDALLGLNEFTDQEPDRPSDLEPDKRTAPQPDGLMDREPLDVADPEPPAVTDPEPGAVDDGACVDPARDCATPDNVCMKAACDAGTCTQVPWSGPLVSCTTSLPGICAAGVRQCDAQGNLGDCTGESPRMERCDIDELDEDCDGKVNEEGPGCSCGDGYLSKGEECDDGGTKDGDRCSATCERERVLQISAKARRTCALLHDGRVKCWGDNRIGALGQGNLVDRGVSAGQMGADLPAVDLGTGKTATAVAAGTCAILNDGDVKCWGSGSVGTLGLGDTEMRGDEPGEMGDNLPTVALGTSDPVKAIATDIHSCVVLLGGFVKCWGYNNYGQLGLGHKEDLGDEPGEMGNDLPRVDLGIGSSGYARKAIHIANNVMHTCALLDDGGIKCWGRNGNGQLGLGDTADRGDEPDEMGDNLPAVDLGAGKTASAIAVGYSFTCALLNDGNVKCWGAGNAGHLGLGDEEHRGDEPGEMGDALPAVDLGAGKTAKAIAAGDGHACAILNDGSVKCWGDNWNGEAGQGDRIDRGGRAGQMGDNLPPIDLGTGMTATAITAGQDHTCAILNDGSVKCWGASVRGELGLGDYVMRGNEPGEMGDQLPTVKLYSDTW